MHYKLGLWFAVHVSVGNLSSFSNILWKTEELKAKVTAAQKRKSTVTLAITWKLQFAILPMILDLHNKHTSTQIKSTAFY